MPNKNNITIKTSEEISIMQEGGKRLARVKKCLIDAVKEGVSAFEIDSLADRLIKEKGGNPSFKMVPNYNWATCVNVNEGVVHGIPKEEIVFKKGDVVSVDVGMFYKGFHTDTSFSVGIGSNDSVDSFLATGRKALKKAISKVRVGGRIYDISLAIEETVKEKGYSPVRALVGHGIGRQLHEDPQIPCFVGTIKPEDSPVIPEGAVLAIEVMYTKGSGDVEIADDGWTIVTSDGKISALFEETVAVDRNGAKVLTSLNNNQRH